MPLLHRLAVLTLVVVLAVLVLVACTADESSSPTSDATSGPSSGTTSGVAGESLEDLPVKKLTVPREPFCELVSQSAVGAVLQVEQVPPVESYGNGERARLTRSVRDLSHEFSCTWEGPDGSVAHAWLFAPPTDRATARDLTSALRGTRGCEELTDAAAYGAPSVSVTCDPGPGRRVLRAGLLGEAWLSCSLRLPDQVPDEELVRRSSDWCAGLLVALTGRAAIAG